MQLSSMMLCVNFKKEDSDTRSPESRPSTRSKIRAKVGAVVGSVALSGALMVAQPAPAQAQIPLPPLPTMPLELANMIDGINQGARAAAWDTRNGLIAQVRAILPPEAANPIAGAIDGVINLLFPGLIAERSAPPAPPAFDRGPCPVWADACVDLRGGRSWLQHNGQVTHVAPSSAGAPSPATATPTGVFKVQYKVKNEISNEFGGAPMPNAVYFTNQGHAFHAGTVGLLSHGCVHLKYADSEVFFNTLQPGNTVYIY